MSQTPASDGPGGEAVTFGLSLGDECGSCGHPLNWHMTPDNPTRRCHVSGCDCAAFSRPSQSPAAREDGAALDRAALDKIAVILGGSRGDHRDNVVMLAQDALLDPSLHNARRARALAVVDRLLDSHDDLVRGSVDPGTEALAAAYEARQFVQQGGGAVPDATTVLVALREEMRDHAKSWHDRSEAQAGFSSSIALVELALQRLTEGWER